MTDRYEHRTRDNMAERICLAIGFVAGMAFTLGASAALATPWTDGDGNPNPECLSTKCHETGVKDKPIGIDPEPREPSTQWAEVHNGFSCYHEGAWVYHAAARFDMSQQHDSAAKNEALDRLERLGDAVAMTKVCRDWQINAGFQIAAVL